MNRRPWTIWPVVAIAAALLTLTGSIAGCRKRIAVDSYPPGVLRVRFVQAHDYTDCLVAATVMCANYVAGANRLQPLQVREGLQGAGLDPTQVEAMRTWLAQVGFELVPLKGEFSDQPQTGLGWWIHQRGYPAICVINRFAGDADYNHAVVVIGFDPPGPASEAQGVYLLDPAAAKRLVRLEIKRFEHYWACGDYVMLPLFETPAELRNRHPDQGENR